MAREQHCIIAEVIRRGAETVASTYPPLKGPAKKVWSQPPPIRGRLLLVDSGALADAIRGESDHSLPRPALKRNPKVVSIHRLVMKAGSDNFRAIMCTAQ